jgi:hypothetical protein
MSLPADNKAESGEFEEDGAEEPAEGAENLDVDHLIRSMDRLKRRGVRVAEPAWRRLERYREDRHTEELLSDFEDYDIGADEHNGAAVQTRPSAAARTARKKRKH